MIKEYNINEKINGNLLNCKPVKEFHNGVEISVDPRVELISIIELLTKDYQSTWRGTISDKECQYKTEVFNFFGKFENHKVIDSFKKMSLKKFDSENPPFSYGAPSNTMLYLESDFKLNKDFYLKDFMMRRVGGKDSIDNFIRELKEFYKDTNFELFYEKNKSYYMQIISNTKRAIGTRNYIEQLEKFYGTKQKSYSIILVSLYMGCYGHSISTKGEDKHIFSISCVLDKGIEVCANAQRFYNNLLTHEFSHSFVNPITDKYLDEVNKYKSNEIINEVKTKSAYIDWYDIVNEYLIRAITIKLNEQDNPSNYRVIEKEINNGFSRIQYVLNKISVYLEKRDKFKTFEEFYFEVLESYKST